MSAITPEERAFWHGRMTDKLWCGDPDWVKFALRLLDALDAANALADKVLAELVEREDPVWESIQREKVEQAEARAEQAEAERDVLALEIAKEALCPREGEAKACVHKCNNTRAAKCWVEWAEQEAQKRTEQE